MGAIASQITSLTIVYSTVYSDADQRKHHSSASLAFVWGIHRGPVNSPHKWPVTRKMFPFDDVIMIFSSAGLNELSLKLEAIADWELYGPILPSDPSTLSLFVPWLLTQPAPLNTQETIFRIEPFMAIIQFHFIWHKCWRLEYHRNYICVEALMVQGV